MRTLTILCLCLCTILFSCATNSAFTDYFNDKASTGDNGAKENYLVKNDGTKIYGNKVNWQGGLLLKKSISIDGQSYPISEIRAYKTGKEFYGRLNGTYVKRIVQGKINVYVTGYTQVETSSATGIQRQVTHTAHYYQKGDYAPLVLLTSNADYKKVLADCPLALSMVSKSTAEMRKAIRNNINYLNEAFGIYNNECKTVK